MGYDDRREILERLEALERLLRGRHDDRGGWQREHRGDRERGRRNHHHHHHDHHDHDCGHDRCCGGDFEERRIIDTIVQLVTEQVGRLIDDQQARSRQSGDGGGEKRIVDLIVGLVSEHVQEIVATELDRRLGRHDTPGAGATPPATPPEPEQP